MLHPGGREGWVGIITPTMGGLDIIPPPPPIPPTLLVAAADDATGLIKPPLDWMGVEEVQQEGGPNPGRARTQGNANHTARRRALDSTLNTSAMAPSTGPGVTDRELLPLAPEEKLTMAVLGLFCAASTAVPVE